MQKANFIFEMKLNQFGMTLGMTEYPFGLNVLTV